MGLLYERGAGGIALLLWPVILLEVPRYVLSALAVVRQKPYRFSAEFLANPPKYAVTIAGHNEADAIADCVKSLHEQSLPPDEVIVISDGSTDTMLKELRVLMQAGLITDYHNVELRGGKAAAVNLALGFVKHKFFVNIDCDCSFDRHAMKYMLSMLQEPGVGCISGNIMVRNQDHRFLPALQSIEYIIRIGLGRVSLDMFNQVSCVSGAFGGFRTDAIRKISGMDAGSGEDLDLTIRLRDAGSRVVFGEEAICYTDVPDTAERLIGQRLRWERDAFALRLRKHGQALNPWSRRFKFGELMHHFDFIFFDFFATLITPFFLLSFFGLVGTTIWKFLGGIFICYLALDLLMILVAVAISRRYQSLKLLFFLPAYTLYNTFFIRILRFVAYTSEALLSASKNDNYVPGKIRKLDGYLR